MFDKFRLSIFSSDNTFHVKFFVLEGIVSILLDCLYLYFMYLQSATKICL